MAPSRPSNCTTDSPIGLGRRGVRVANTPRGASAKGGVNTISGAVERGIGRSDAEAIFDTCAKFAEYGFNKSHSAPYALLTYQTAYMKANYPVEFLAASMTLDMGNTDKLAEFRAEEVEHRDTAIAAGAERAPAYPLLSAAIRLGCRVAIGLSERI